MPDHLTDDELIHTWRIIRREHRDYVASHRGQNPPGVLVQIAAIRREGERRGIDMHDIPPEPRPAAVIRRELAAIDRRLERLRYPAATRAQATTREARAGQLSQRRDALMRELRLAESADGE